jgi:hypothetical protein
MGWHLPRRLRFAFHSRIRAGDIDGMLDLLIIDRRLVNVRNKKQATALMAAAIHPDARLSVQMIELLVEKGATLGSRDCRQRHALLHACKHGASRAVVKALVASNERQGGAKFRWHDLDNDGLTALMLASMQGNTQVAIFLLNKVDIQRSAKQSHPFKLLKAAIDTGNERHALAIGRHEKIRASIHDPELTRYKGSGVPELAATIATCTEAALEKDMLALVQEMNQLNWRKVSRVVWYTINKLVQHGVEVTTVISPQLLKIGRQFTSAWRWSLVRELFVARYKERSHPLARLPDAVLHQVVAFAVPQAFRHPSEFVGRWCTCYDAQDFGECYWHDSYKATRSDYFRAYNYGGRYGLRH